MLFAIETKLNGETTLSEEMGDVAAMNAIENWQSRFTDKPRTRYGRRITLEYVRGLDAGERGQFVQPLLGKSKEIFNIVRVA